MFDENLQTVSRELSLIARVEGTKIVLDGEEENVLIGGEVIKSLVDIVSARSEERRVGKECRV